ncbi:unnamed protein product [Coffea canephora]|uniref:Uncharacterized protein n=1 Tax=Coffea canephora TaxID=49390 RepID=A0A068U9A1_COFCA|nr:unnamed protein product [Coffea canephora]
MDLLQQKLAELIQTYQTVQKDLEFLRFFLEMTEDQRNQNEELQAIWSRVVEVVYRAELEIDWTLVGRDWTLVAGDINLLKSEAQVIYDSISCGDEIKRPNETVTLVPSQVTATTYNQDLVGFQEEVEAITCRLTSRLTKLDVVSIVGMPGLGKTTLANAVYTSPSVMSHFHIRGWCTVSQEYSNHNLLVQILSSINSGNPNQYLEMNEGDLAIKLKQDLLKNRYLLVLDDLWGIEAWNFLEKLLPDDAKGSRILITSRLQNLSLADSKAHSLRYLSEEESWELMQKKLVGKEGHLAKLSGVGFQIAKSCGGLPLTIVLVAGILAATAEDRLEKVAESLTSSSVLEDKSCMKTLDLSYSHLSGDLKPCFLYFSAFQEDENIPVRRLLWLWISERFVQKTEGKSLEDAANDFLKDLVDRSLVMVSKHRTMGGAKACRIHDLVHEFCVKKAKEENFLHIVRRGKDLSCLTDLSKPVRRVCDQNASNSKILEIMPPFPELRGLLLFKNSGLMPKKKDLGSKVLEVLDLGNLVFDAHFPMEVVALVDLRYLALHIGGIESVPSAIGNLERLQTFLVRGNSRNTLLPETIWNIKTLRHLCTTSSSYGFTFPVENLDQLDTLTVATDRLDQLDALTLAIDPNSQSLQKILAKVPSIRRLKCFSEEVARNCDTNLAFDCLSQLESLSLHRFGGCRFEFPLSLKKLTLSSNRQPWSEISTIGNLPNLEALKLLHDSFVGEKWEMKEKEFPKLQVLKLFGLDFRSWTATPDATSDDHFPLLKNLVVQYCEELEELPDCLGECTTFEMIQVSWCRKSVVASVKQIQNDLVDKGIQVLKIVTECFDDEEEVVVEEDDDDDDDDDDEEESIPTDAESIPSQSTLIHVP